MRVAVHDDAVSVEHGDAVLFDGAPVGYRDGRRSFRTWRRSGGLYVPDLCQDAGDAERALFEVRAAEALSPDLAEDDPAPDAS